MVIRKRALSGGLSGDPELDALVEDVKKLYNNELASDNEVTQTAKKMFQQQPVVPPTPGNTHGTTYKPSTEDHAAAAGIEFTGYQAPLKGTFYNSGSFSLNPTDPRHPQGHLGVDMRASAGTPIYPLTDGVVTNVGPDPKGGNVVNIQHPNGVRSYYAHLATATVHKGDKVDKDTVIGTVGNTGNANVTWPHLHFQVWTNNQIQNPEKFFAMPKYTNVDKKKETFWLSDEAKQQAQAFNMQQHLAGGASAKTQLAFKNEVDKIVKVSQIYLELAAQESQ
jgi:Membrane proteins related to metalloendopeptidases